MANTYVIRWKSRTNGRAGCGTALFEYDEALRLAEELNRDYPEIEHWPVETQAPPRAEETADHARADRN